MSQWRKRPVVIEAWQIPPINVETVREPVPSWLFGAMVQGVVVPDQEKGGASIKTLEGVMRAEVGDYIIQGVRGELYSCKAGIFEQTYERVPFGSNDASARVGRTPLS